MRIHRHYQRENASPVFSKVDPDWATKRPFFRKHERLSRRKENTKFLPDQRIFTLWVDKGNRVHIRLLKSQNLHLGYRNHNPLLPRFPPIFRTCSHSDLPEAQRERARADSTWAAAPPPAPHLPACQAPTPTPPSPVAPSRARRTPGGGLDLGAAPGQLHKAPHFRPGSRAPRGPRPHSPRRGSGLGLDGQRTPARDGLGAGAALRASAAEVCSDARAEPPNARRRRRLARPASPQPALLAEAAQPRVSDFTSGRSAPRRGRAVTSLGGPFRARGRRARSCRRRKAPDVEAGRTRRDGGSLRLAGGLASSGRCLSPLTFSNRRFCGLFLLKQLSLRPLMRCGKDVSERGGLGTAAERKLAGLMPGQSRGPGARLVLCWGLLPKATYGCFPPFPLL